jgi:hypothetical protein
MRFFAAPVSMSFAGCAESASTRNVLGADFDEATCDEEQLALRAVTSR